MDALAVLAVIMAGLALHLAGGSRVLKQRVDTLERSLESLQRAVRELRAGRGTPTGPAAAAPPAAPGTAAPPRAETPPRLEPPPPPERPRPSAQPPASRPPAIPSPPPPPRGPRTPALDVDWEQMLGVRGAAVAGGAVLALAGLYFFRYSIEHGLVPPWLRVVVGTLVGVGCIAAAEWRIRERYATTANALVGGGAAVLYAAFWAARALYGLVPAPVGAGLMLSVTGASTALAYRHRSLVIALIALVGGFATPLLLSTGSDRPIQLFAYILLLDGALLFIAQRRGWPLLALLSLAGTLFYQVLWIGLRMRDEQIAIGLVVLAIFAVAFAVSLRSVPTGGRRQWLVTQGGGALLPFLFALHLADRADFGAHLAPVALLLAVLSASACWLGRGLRRAWLGLGAAAGSVAVVAVWLVGHRPDTALAWETAGLCALLAGVFHVFVELDRDRTGLASPAPAATLSSLGLLALLAFAAVTGRAPLWPWLAGQVALAGLALRHGSLPGRGPQQAGAVVLLAAGLALFRWTRSGPAALLLTVDAGVCVALAVALQAFAVWRRAARWSERAAAAFALLALATFGASDVFVEGAPLLALGAALLLGLLAVLAATRLASGRWQIAALAVTAAVESVWTHGNRFPAPGDAAALTAMGLLLATVALFAFWPFAVRARFADEPLAWWASILAPAAGFAPLKELYAEHVGAASIGAVPVVLGLFSLAGAAVLRRTRPSREAARDDRLAWYLAAAFGFATVAVPLQLEKEWITLGWALEGLAVLVLWRRFDHPGLKAFALALFAGVTVRLVANEAVLGYYPRPAWRIVNWLLYTYLVPAACLVAGARVLRPLEVARARTFESWLYREGQPVCASALGAAAVAVVFVWMNLAIADWFATGDTLRVSFERLPARDLATSIAWAVYALALLALGVLGRSRGPRWISLGLMLVTAVKVFLHDLGHLEDLYRVGSLLGLAVSLILISLGYQRFVVREPASEDA